MTFRELPVKATHPMSSEMAGIEERLDKMNAHLASLSGEVAGLSGIVARVDSCVVRIEERLGYLDPEHRISSLERASSATRERPGPKSDPVRKELDSLSDEIDDTRTALKLSELQRAHDREIATLERKLATAEGTQTVGLERWKVVALIVTTAGAILAAALTGRATKPDSPSVPYAVPAHTGRHAKDISE